MWDISLLNIYMLLATIPEYSFDSDDDEVEQSNEEVKALEKVFKGMRF